MTTVGIEAMNVFAGTCQVNVEKLAIHRGLDTARFDNLLMKEKTVALPYEDPVTFGVNAAKPIIDAMSPEERDRIELVITATESAFDFGKSMSTYFHSLLGLNRNCRLFEIKNACYSGVAALQMAANFILAQTSPGAKALVIATDITRFMVAEGGDALSEDWSFAEPSGGAGAVAMLISDTPNVFQIDVGASGYYGHEVMDTCRPLADSEAGNAELSLLSYLDCCENAFLEYQRRVGDVDFVNSFGYLAFHTPFGGMIKGAHRNLMRKFVKARPAAIEEDFQRRMHPGLTYCQRVGNVMGATTMLSLASTIDNADLSSPQRVGVFSYGSGCCSEFFSGVVRQESQDHVRRFEIEKHLDKRYELSMPEYDMLLRTNHAVKFGTRNAVLDTGIVPEARKTLGKELLFLKRINEFHREYEWLS
ncbi:MULTISPECIES: hydroxymethylglutaryl-CoA synthase family protein [Streptomycetaceae]|uniref:hydroxymethylglutaryl-CoA synthase family protein n=1 Tax=Streptomycetaceae TaxID=2062 RepID=UPI000CDCC8D7|nr:MULTISPECIES: hydroxymethylglutaryl-CoA synthase family protein [Streptomycetaceae]AUY48415.1 3-hydroxy-3-methylglutaryl-ACP synthase [Streptomyces sp. CB01881]MBP0454649.1 hydroxymethylglutaryl-CoA synthase family protein [Kitasatospora sp. RG8]TYC76905.1 hydroxymethylglutaryl-CoA synthase family protein [Streptomyces sp. CB01881]